MKLGLFSSGRVPAHLWDAYGESPPCVAALAESSWDDECEITSPDYMGLAAKAALLVLPVSLLFYLEPALDDCLPPILPPWPNSSTMGKLYVRVKFSLRTEFIKIKDVLAPLQPVCL